MADASSRGNYVRDQQHPQFTYDAPGDEEIPAVGAVAGTSAIAPVSSVGSGIDPILQWQAFSEQLKARRLAHEEAERQLAERQRRRAAGADDADAQAGPADGEDEDDNEPRSAAERALDAAEAAQSRTAWPGGGLESEGSQLPEGSRMAEAGQAYAANAEATGGTARYSDRSFQADYEADTVEVSHAPNPLMLGLHRHLTTVNTPGAGSYIEGPQHEEESPAVSQGRELMVGEVMTRKVVCVLPSTTIEQVASLCNRRGFSGVPVVNDKQHLIGIVTLSDILRQLLSQKSISGYADLGGGLLEQSALAVLDEPVRSYMHQRVITVVPETTVREACETMLKHRIKRVVVARGETVKGIFSAQDALQLMASHAFTVPAEEAK